MNPHVYNAFLLLGLVLMGAGLAMFNVPLALTTVGALIVALTFFGPRQ